MQPAPLAVDNTGSRMHSMYTEGDCGAHRRRRYCVMRFLTVVRIGKETRPILSAMRIYSYVRGTRRDERTEENN